MEIANSSLTHVKQPLYNISQVRNFLKSRKNDDSHWTEELSDNQLKQELLKLSHVKRFYERWEAGADFKHQVLDSPEQVVSRYGLNLTVEEIQQLLNEAINQNNEEALPVLLPVGNYEKFIKDNIKWCYELRRIADSSKNARFKAWRERQMARTISELNEQADPPTIHAPVCFELSKGCSVGCWFCGVSAPRLGDIFTYNDSNATLWRGVLELMKEILGPAAGAGFCYLATDPLDNPDYEKLCNDFHEILGFFPQTTTAQAMKDPERTRSLLKLSLSKGCMVNRFSILSLKVLEQLYQEFTPEELTFVRLVLQNSESGLIKSNSGRAREYNKRKSAKTQEEFDDTFAGSTACVSGFLFNMVERSVKLISPCNADERWPLGYRIYEQGTFTNVDDLKILLEEMIDRHMAIAVRPHDRIGFRRDLRYETLPDGFQVATRFHAHKLRNKSYMKQLGEVIHKGEKTAEEIARMFNIFGVPAISIYQSLNLMFKHGILNDEPEQSIPIDEQKSINSQAKALTTA